MSIDGLLNVIVHRPGAASARMIDARGPILSGSGKEPAKGVRHPLPYNGTSATSAGRIMKRELIRVEPYSTNFEKWGAPVSVAARAGDTIYISGMPPFNPQTGEVENAPFEEQAERVMAQLKHALETVGSDLSHVLKCNIFCTSPDYFKPFNDVYERYFEVGNQPARIFTIVPKWTGPFDVEIDCVAVARD
jgi:2-iminobutanoate/2-iminopropanoate deaminase